MKLLKIILVLLFFSCVNSKIEISSTLKYKIIEKTKKVIDSFDNNYKIIVEITTYDTIFNFEKKNDGYNSIVKITKKNISEETVIYLDSIFTTFHDVKIQDVNNDSINDVLVHVDLCIGSNCRYNLYQINKDTTFKVKHFNQILNPIYNKQFDLFVSYVENVNSYTEFYILNGTKIKKEKLMFYGVKEDSTRYKMKLKKSLYNIRNNK